MFANAFRTQARAALVAGRARTFTTNAAVPRLLRSAILSRSTQCRSRFLSTTPVMAQATSNFEASEVAEEDSRQSIQNGRPPSNTLYVANMPWSITVADLEKQFDVFGEIVSIRMGKNPNGTMKGYGHIHFANKEDAIAAFESAVREPIFMGGRELRFEFARDSLKTPPAVPSNKLFFAGFDGTEREIRSLLGEYEQEVDEVFFLKDRQTGDYTGSGFINFPNEDVATAALLASKNAGIKLSYAKPRKEDQERRFKDRRGDRRGDGRGDRRDSRPRRNSRREYDN